MDVGWAPTDGGFRAEPSADGWRIVPLPDGLSFRIRLRAAALALGPAPIVLAEGMGGRRTLVRSEIVDGKLRFGHEEPWVAYFVGRPKSGSSARNRPDGSGPVGSAPARAEPRPQEVEARLKFRRLHRADLSPRADALGEGQAQIAAEVFAERLQAA